MKRTSGLKLMCELCGENHPPYSRLIDQNHHTWDVCAECVKYLWTGRQQENRIEGELIKAEAAIDLVLFRLRNVLLGDEQ
jgi:uncharacterized protein with PIN domain